MHTPPGSRRSVEPSGAGTPGGCKGCRARRIRARGKGACPNTLLTSRRNMLPPSTHPPDTTSFRRRTSRIREEAPDTPHPPGTRGTRRAPSRKFPSHTRLEDTRPSRPGIADKQCRGPGNPFWRGTRRSSRGTRLRRTRSSRNTWGPIRRRTRAGIRRSTLHRTACRHTVPIRHRTARNRCSSRRSKRRRSETRRCSYHRSKRRRSESLPSPTPPWTLRRSRSGRPRPRRSRRHLRSASIARRTRRRRRTTERTRHPA